MFVNKTKVTVRYVETDKMGIVHHSNYYAWFEIGRGEFITESGISYKKIEEEGVMFPLVESGCKYLVGAEYDDDLIIETSIKELNPVKVIFNYNVIRESDSKLLSKGKTTHAFVNNNFKIINIQKKHPAIWEKLSALYEK